MADYIFVGVVALVTGIITGVLGAPAWGAYLAILVVLHGRLGRRL